MRKLDRNSAAAPNCLAQFRHGQDTWNDVGGAEKSSIRASLEQMQGRRCAYCEGDLDALGQHIEHFWRKAHYPALTFEWTNLYWSCDQADSCGHYKDHGAGAYNAADLIKPCCDNPDAYFRFRSDGAISVRPGLSQHDRHRAEETLRVFGLNPQWGRLRNMRKQALAGYIAAVDEARKAELSADEMKAYFTEELEQTVGLPFATAIRHVLTESA